jgi:hypothetical protein
MVQQQEGQANEEDTWPLANLGILERSHTATVFGESRYEPRKYVQSVSVQDAETRRLREQAAVEFEA